MTTLMRTATTFPLVISVFIPPVKNLQITSNTVRTKRHCEKPTWLMLPSREVQTPDPPPEQEGGVSAAPVDPLGETLEFLLPVAFHSDADVHPGGTTFSIAGHVRNKGGGKVQWGDPSSRGFFLCVDWGELKSSSCPLLSTVKPTWYAAAPACMRLPARAEDFQDEGNTPAGGAPSSPIRPMCRSGDCMRPRQSPVGNFSPASKSPLRRLVEIHQNQRRSASQSRFLLRRSIGSSV